MRSLVRGVKHLCGAVLILAGLICAAEVGLRGYTWHQEHNQKNAVGAANDLTSHVIPSSETYQQLRPLANIRLSTAGGREVLLQTNSFGLRGPEPHQPKPAGTFRVVCLGDERTIAAEAPLDETYCARLQERLQSRTNLRVEVINAGLPGGCPLTELILLSHRLIGLQPDLVLVHLDATDISDDRLIRPFTFVDDAERPVAAIHPRLRGSRTSPLLSLSQEFRLVDLARRQLASTWEQRTAAADTSWNESDRSVHIEQALQPLNDLKHLAGGAYSELVVSTISDPLADHSAQVAESAEVRPVAHANNQSAPSVTDYATANQLLYVDASPYLPNGGVPRGQGLTPEEHDLYAAVLAAFIVQNIPGVWSEAETTHAPNLLPPLPDLARTPRQ